MLQTHTMHQVHIKSCFHHPLGFLDVFTVWLAKLVDRKMYEQQRELGMDQLPLEAITYQSQPVG